jgi:cytochrome P450
MSKLTNFLNEVLRVNPPVPGLLQRILRNDTQLVKYTILKGASINIMGIPNNHYSK